MPRLHVPSLPLLCLALAMALLSPAFAETKPSLMGKTREQAVTQLGEPKSNIRVGAREMLFFAKVKLTLRNDVVIEVEDLPEEAPLPPLAPVAPKRGPEASTARPEQTVTQPQASQGNPPAAQTTPPPAAETSPAAPVTKATEAPPKPVKPPEPAIAIKFIKSGASSPKAAGPAATTSAPTEAATTAKTSAPTVAAAPAEEAKKATPPKPSTVAPTDGKVATAAKPTAAPAKTEPAPAATKSATALVAETEKAAAETVEPTAEDVPAKPKVDAKKRAARRSYWRARRDAETEETTVEIFSGRSYAIATIVIVGGIAFMWWRHNQRKLELEATAVSHSPFTAPVNVDPSAMFTTEQVGQLGQSKFEQLVASYYAKTGVVAERTNAEPGAPIHIKIFWKGEQKPFAGVQCHANPPALIPAKPLESLFEALTAADIRRGYIVTNGKFSVEARDFAAEKVFTLLSGDLFLEKLNALPPAARAELLKEMSAHEPPAPTAKA